MDATQILSRIDAAGDAQLASKVRSYKYDDDFIVGSDESSEDKDNNDDAEEDEASSGNRTTTRAIERESAKTLCEVKKMKRLYYKLNIYFLSLNK